MTRRLAIWLATACLVVLVPSTAWADPAPAVTAATASHYYNNDGSYAPVKAFDGNTTTTWISANPRQPGTWLQAEYASTFYVTSYSIRDRGVAGEHPTAWVLKGSTDGTTWTTLDTVTSAGISTGVAKSFDVDSPAVVKFLRWDGIDGAPGITSIAEAVAVASPQPTPTPTPSASSTPAPTVTATVTAPASEVVTVVDNAQALDTELTGPELVAVAAVGLVIAFLSVRVVLSL